MRWDLSGIAFAFTLDHCTVVGDTCKIVDICTELQLLHDVLFTN